jgi:hypothetical protein
LRSADTHPDAERVQLELLRNATVAQRFALASSLTDVVMHLARQALMELYPTDDPDQFAVRFVTHLYGAELGEGLRRDLEARRLRQRQS